MNNYVTVGVIRFSVFFYWYGISIPKFPSRCRTARFPDQRGEMRWEKSVPSDLFRIAGIPVDQSSDKQVWLCLE